MKLNAAQLALVATGASAEVILAAATAPEANPPGNPLAADANAAPGADAAAAAAATSAAATGAATPTAPPAGEGTGITAPADSGVVAQLNTQLADVNAQLITARVEVEGLKAKVAAVDTLASVLRSVIGEKMVALGASATAATALPIESLAAEYTRIDAVFKGNFRPGGVAAVASPEDNKPNTKATVDHMFAAAVETSIAQ